MSDYGSHSNVVSFPFDRVKPRRVIDTEAADYLTSVNNLMKDQAGLPYIKVRELLHGNDKEFIRSALDKGISPQQFVDHTLLSYGLLKAENVGNAALTGEYNRARIACIEFADEMNHDGWFRSLQGVAIKEISNDEGMVSHIVVMNPFIAKDREGAGFKITVSECSHEITPNGVSIILPTKTAHIFKGEDIEDVYAQLKDFEAQLKYSGPTLVR